MAPAVRIAIAHEAKDEDMPVLAGRTFDKYAYINGAIRTQIDTTSQPDIDLKNRRLCTLQTQLD